MQLDRFAYSPMGTFGKLSFDRFWCYTVEPPWRDDKQNVSCIPEGVYTVRRQPWAKRLSRLWKLVDVPGRSGIYLHSGNTKYDTEGCILLGRYLGALDGGTWAVIDSKETLIRFAKATLGLDEIILTIRQVIL
jgi:hypothetical protein